VVGEGAGYPVGDLGGGGARGEDLGHAELLEHRDVLVGDDAAAEDANVRGVALGEELEQPAERTERPIRSASSWMAVSTICSGVWCSPV
jgi:hypothetical protein